MQNTHARARQLKPLETFGFPVFVLISKQQMLAPCIKHDIRTHAEPVTFVQVGDLAQRRACCNLYLPARAFHHLDSNVFMTMADPTVFQNV